MRFLKMTGMAAVGLVVFVGSAMADGHDTKCNLLSAGSALGIDYNQVGSEACMKLCSGTDGCVAWVYTPHNFNPKTAPGECRMLPDVSAEEEDSRMLCGRMNK